MGIFYILRFCTHTAVKLYVLNKLFCFPFDVLFTPTNFMEIPFCDFIKLDFQTINMHLKCEWTIECVFIIDLTRKLRLAPAGCFIYNLMIEFSQKKLALADLPC